MDNALIQVTQLPVIEEHLHELKATVEAETQSAMGLVCTEDTIQTVKTKRADLNKRFAELEAQRKAIKAAVMAPWEHFEAVYKECVTEPFKAADNDLKGKVNDVEAEIKDRCEVYLRDYFDEIKTLNSVEWLTFEQLGLKIDLATAKQKTPKKLMDTIKTTVERVVADMELIDQSDDAAELAVEYKRTLDYAGAMRIVTERKRQREIAAKEQEARRSAQEALQGAVGKVDILTPPTEEKAPTEPQRALQCVFKVWATKEQLKKLKEYLTKEGIKFE